MPEEKLLGTVPLMVIFGRGVLLGAVGLGMLTVVPIPGTLTSPTKVTPVTPKST
jgi:hypothetical protein